jgi:hypothetical protein
MRNWFWGGWGEARGNARLHSVWYYTCQLLSWKFVYEIPLCIICKGEALINNLALKVKFTSSLHIKDLLEPFGVLVGVNSIKPQL